MGGGLLTMELSYKSSRPPFVHWPFEDELARNVECPHCKLDHTVFGLATWCADCGEEIFLTHVQAELEVTRQMLTDIARRKELLGNRAATKDLENCLEDAVSIFEASVKAVVRRALKEQGYNDEDTATELKKVGNAFQNINRTHKELKRLFGFEAGMSELWEILATNFEKRHPVTHNLGIIDRRYLEKNRRAEREGREIRITIEEVLELVDRVHEAIALIYKNLGSSAESVGDLRLR